MHLTEFFPKINLHKINLLNSGLKLDHLSMGKSFCCRDLIKSFCCRDFIHKEILPKFYWHATRISFTGFRQIAVLFMKI